jgi:hypothetical protein
METMHFISRYILSVGVLPLLLLGQATRPRTRVTMRKMCWNCLRFTSMACP